MRTETVSRILLTVVVLALLSGIGYYQWVNPRPLIFWGGVIVAGVALWWIWFHSVGPAETPKSSKSSKSK